MRLDAKLMAKKPRQRVEPDREPRSQSAALPWRRADDGTLLVLLITSRETRRWVIPKGWPIRGLNRSATAAQEAFEEAGVRGELQKPKLGVYRYDKRLRTGRLQSVRVTVYPLKVLEEHDQWPELGQRDKLWVTPDEATKLVDEPKLKALFMGFSPQG
jgi:8-oxo-dGTP pyrophosphatase MutT (NUDIX family)